MMKYAIALHVEANSSIQSMAQTFLTSPNNPMNVHGTKSYRAFRNALFEFHQIWLYLSRCQVTESTLREGPHLTKCPCNGGDPANRVGVVFRVEFHVLFHYPFKKKFQGFDGYFSANKLSMGAGGGGDYGVGTIARTKFVEVVQDRIKERNLPPA